MAVDLLANVERPASDRPAPTPEETAPRGYWPGSAVGLVEHWRRRALAAEAALREARAQVAEHVRRRVSRTP